MREKSAKDKAFDKERVKYHKQIRELERELKNEKIKNIELTEKVEAAEEKCEQLQDWINRLLEYTEMSEEDMKRIIQKEKIAGEAMEHFESMMGIFRFGGFGGGYL